MRKKISAILTAFTFVLGNFTWFPAFSAAAVENGKSYWKLVDVKDYYGEELVNGNHTYTWEKQDGWDTEHWKYHCHNLTTSGNSGEHPDKDIGVNGVVHDHTGETMDHYFYVTPLKETYLPGETAEVDVRYHFETTVPPTCQAILCGTGMPSVGETVDEAWEGCGFKICWDNREGVEYVRARNANNPGEVGLYSKIDGETRRNLDNEGTASFQMPDADNGDYWGKVFVGYTVHAGNSDGYTTVFTYEWVKGLSVSIQPKSYYLIDEKADIPITITGDIPGDAWITFVPSDVEHTEEEGDKCNIGCVWLKDITDGLAHLTVPSKPGQYDIRVYDGDSADTAREIAYQTVDVVYSDLKAKLSADVKTVKPGESVKVSVNILSGTARKDAWVSFVPSAIEHTEKNSDDYNKDYAYYPDFKDGYVTLTAPRDEGSWDIRLFDGEDGDYASEIDYITLTVGEQAEPAEPEKLEVLASNYNTSAVGNQPTKDSTFTVDRECTAKYLNTYHWNHGTGQAPGTITLLEDGKELGTWQTYGTDGQGGVKNAIWNVRIDPLTLKPGHTYQIVDSDPGTWAQNGGSGGAGIFEVQGTFGNEPETTLAIGDVTGDGVINAKDANIVLIAAARLGTNQSSELTEAQIKAADVNGDGAINAKDAAVILRYAAFVGTGNIRPIESFL